MTNNNFSNDLKKCLSEMQDITMKTAAGAVSSLISANFTIHNSLTSEYNISELEYSEYNPSVIIKTNYTSGINSSSIMVFKQSDIQCILNQLMNKSTTGVSDFKFDDINMSALNEIMNRMMISSAAELSNLCHTTVEVKKPEIYTDSEQSIEKLLNLEPFDTVYVITSELSISDNIKSKFISIITPDMANDIATKMKPAPSVSPDTGIPDTQMFNVSSPFAAPPTQQPVSFNSFQNTLTQEQLNNLQLLMNVPLELSIEIGSTQKKVDDILSFTHGTVLELDCPADAPVNVIVNGHLIARGDVVVVDDYFAVRITEILQSNLLDTLRENNL